MSCVKYTGGLLLGIKDHLFKWVLSLVITVRHFVPVLKKKFGYAGQRLGAWSVPAGSWVAIHCLTGLRPVWLARLDLDSGSKSQPFLGQVLWLGRSLGCTSAVQRGATWDVNQPPAIKKRMTWGQHIKLIDLEFYLNNWGIYHDLLTVFEPICSNYIGASYLQLTLFYIGTQITAPVKPRIQAWYGQPILNHRHSGACPGKGNTAWKGNRPLAGFVWATMGHSQHGCTRPALSLVHAQFKRSRTSIAYRLGPGGVTPYI